MTFASLGREIDPAHRGLVLGGLHGFDLLGHFNQAGVLGPADVHAAIRLCHLAGEEDEAVALAIALAVRAPRVGHVSVDLSDIRTSAAEAEEDVDFDLLPWPDPGRWISSVAGSDVVDSEPSDVDHDRPLKLVGTDLYLQRYWRDEVSVAAQILSRLSTEGRPSALSGTHAVFPGGGDRLERLFPGRGSSDQRSAARLALSHRFSVIAGGPGTGKTTTVARLLAVLFEEAAEQGVRFPLIGLAAPTGKAAARMEEAVRAEAARMDTSPPVREALRQVSGSTLHRLLGTRFDRPGRFRHHTGHRLPHDVVVVDEASMVSLSLMASVVEAVRPDARLVLVGDPEQLVSVEAGAVLADIVGPAGGVEVSGDEAGVAAGAAPDAAFAPTGEGNHLAPAEGGTPAAPTPPIARSVCVLRQNHRFAGSLARLASAVRGGNLDRVWEIIGAGDPSLSWVDGEPGVLLGGIDTAVSGPLTELRASTVEWVRAVNGSAQAGDASEAIAELRQHRVLCAHRRGAAGVRAWNRAIQEWAAGDSDTPAEEDWWYAGRPVMVTANDYPLRLFNGDTGVAVAVPASADGQTGGRLAVAFDEGSARPARLVSPTRLNAVDTVYAMTIHKSQGSEFDRVTLLLPPAASRLLTRELLYTAITRARRAVTVVGTSEALERAVLTPIARASGLGARLWGDVAAGT